MGRLNQCCFMLCTETLAVSPRAVLAVQRGGRGRRYLFNAFHVAGLIVILKILYYLYFDSILQTRDFIGENVTIKN